jgi:hypothetical protein
MKPSRRYLLSPGMFLFSVMEELNTERSVFDPIFLDPFDFFELVDANGRSQIVQSQLTEGQKLRYHSILDQPVLSDCPLVRT